MNPEELLARLKAAAAKDPPDAASARALAAMYCGQCAREARISVLGRSMAELECRHCGRGWAIEIPLDSSD